MIDELLLLSGNDIPFAGAGINIHQPRLKEIALINEDKFWHGCGLLKFNKNLLENQVKTDLSNQSNFNIIMSMIQEKRLEAQQAKINVLLIFTLLFPTCKIRIGKRTIQLQDQNTQEINEINENNFEDLKSILVEMFCLKDSEKQYNPSGELAKKIANQIAKGRKRKAKLAPNTEKVSMLSRYVSILAVGQSKDLNLLMNYTVYQLMDEFTRYQLKLHYDMYDRYRRAGATSLEEPEDWLKDIHEK